MVTTGRAMKVEHVESVTWVTGLVETDTALTKAVDDMVVIGKKRRGQWQRIPVNEYL